MLARDRKVTENRPCLFLEWSKSKGRWEPCAPAVDCSFDCQGCGFDPAEKERRLETGEWVFDENGVKHLLFKSVRPLIPV